MPETLRLKILTPTGLALEATADEVVLPGFLGELGILPGHTPLLALTVSGLLVYVSGGLRAGAAIRRGVAEIRDDQVTVLADEVALADGLDPDDLAAREQRATQSLEAALTLGQPSDQLEDELAYLVAGKSVMGMTHPAR